MCDNKQEKPFSASDYLIHGVYLTIYGVVKYLPSPIGDFLRYWILKPFAKELKKVRLYEGVTVWFPYNLVVGNNVTLNEWVYLSAYGGLEIGDNVLIGHRVTIVTSDHGFKTKGELIREQGIVSNRVVIGDDVWIGANATVLSGVTIGKGAVVAAGAVVTKDIKEFAIVAGVPARQVSSRQ